MKLALLSFGTRAKLYVTPKGILTTAVPPILQLFFDVNIFSPFVIPYY